MPSRLKLSLDAIVVIDAIARHGSFAKAAAELHKVPSALSYTVSQLETALGMQLFERGPRKARLTPAGSSVLAEGRRMLSLAVDAERRLSLIAAGWETELRIAVDTLLGPDWLFPILPAFDALASGTRLSIYEEALEGSWEALAEGRVDLTIAGLAAGGVPSGGGYTAAVIGSVGFEFAVPPGHPLAALHAELGRPLQEDEVRPYRAVSVADSSRARSARTYGLLSGQDVLTLPTMRDKLKAQLAGLGVGFLPRFLAEPAFREGRLVRVPVVQHRPDGTFAVAFRPDSLGKAGRWFAQQLQQDPAVRRHFY